MAKWTEDQTYKFVQDYLKYECLYNVNSVSYKNKKAREEALFIISEGMNIPNFGPKEAYNKIRNLRSTYSQELKKIKESLIPGTDKYYYIPNMKWFKLLDEALKAIKIKARRDSQSDLESELRDETLRLNKSSQSSSEHTKTAEQTRISSTNRNERTPRNSPCPRKKPNYVLSEIYKSTSRRSPDNEFDIFGKSVAAQLKNMPLQLALQSQMYIQNYLSKLRLDHMDQNNSSSSSSVNMSSPPSARECEYIVPAQEEQIQTVDPKLEIEDHQL